jgi:hypothetical protein
MFEHPVLSAIRRESFVPLGWFQPAAGDGVPEGSRFVIMVGNAGSEMFARFDREKTSDSASLDAWCRSVLSHLARTLGAAALYPFDAPPLPFLTWARRAGACHRSPLGLNIHPDFGLWHAYRAAFIFPVVFDLPAARSSSPCESCVSKPCLEACPVGAFSEQSYDVTACTAHIALPQGEPCMAGGCLARRACPIGRTYTYRPPQAAFHMRAFLAARHSPKAVGDTHG